MRKDLRQKKLLSLIKARPFGTQAELRDSLDRAGVPATQSSLSRDIEELGIVKHRGHYTVPKSKGAAARGLLSLDLSGTNLVIARTEAGLASAVAVEIDGAAIREIVGTLAGEDTIFVAVSDQKAQRSAMKQIWELFG
ncbi:MAG: transcriptional regulator of arginine metabolism [Pyrinomonadaceae bacterium]|jgi:transcriptional regulator of arginine metabolism|nr:transcriptional regulator of arginine metabolism [Pyrinomonadaceae bacterium]